MSTQTTLTTPTSAPTASATEIRGKKQRIKTPYEAGLPDPRPITDYTVALSVVAGHSRLTVTLSQPCVIRQPAWALIDCTAGGRVYPSSVTVVSTTQFYFDYGGFLALSVAFVEVPYQDMQVQNFQGGFVRPGGQWFREPVMPG